MHAIKPALKAIGDTITYTAGRHTITLQWVREDVYTVTTYQGTYRIEDQCGSYSTEGLARSVARLYAELAKAETDPFTLADTVPTGQHQQVRPTMAGAHLADVTDVQHRALATAAMFGRVERSADHNVRTLKALARKGYLTLVMRPGKRYDVAHGVITERGERELTRLDAIHDRQEKTAAHRAALSHL
ncbi:hypothetical protein ACN27G_27445 [Plantactinospora sp. WMMB334]|uniref:hypothetical protein n=1 Tax=Plantactinospora sp. WMMB334 TaxID=3404119 RepID=UPI003B922924